jgi:prepilin-type processing-associated H-X9-DG protein
LKEAATRSTRSSPDCARNKVRRGAAIALGVASLLACGAARAACMPMSFDGASYTTCTFDMKRDDLRLYWRDGDGKPYGNFSALARRLKAKGRTLRFAMNAGMFEEDLSPVGLYVEDSKRAQRADTRDGDSNFHMKPNGVFWIGDKVAGVVETSRYLANPPPARFATQSGPMLVIDGRIHPRILPTGSSEKLRNGVCVRDGINVIFAISDHEVTFHAFARFFKDGLNCANALFLDGSVSSLYAPDINRDDELAPLGPMVGVSVAAP